MGVCAGSKKRTQPIKMGGIEGRSNGTTASNSVSVNPALFVLERTGDFREYYEVGKKLGGGRNEREGIGAYGTVYTCDHKATRQKRAVKVMDKTAIEESERERFLCEIQILRIMDHPNIVKLYEVFQDKKRYYLVTEYFILSTPQTLHLGRTL